MITRTVDELGRVVIPGDMRSRLGIDAKSKVSMEAVNGAIIIKIADPNGVRNDLMNASSFAGYVTAI